MNKLYIEKAIEFRRYFHENPELGFNEFGTANYIRDFLSNANIQWVECTPTGTIAIIGRGEKCIALRADIDALPITEETGLPFSSRNNGIMHACGHDFHSATLLATALYLKDNESALNHKVKLIFQPAEEVQPGGAIKMIEEGVLNNPKVNEIFGFHIFPELNTGKLAVSPGYVMAATNEVYITIKGKAHHAAQPHIGNDAILAAAKIIDYFQSIITKFRNPIEPAVISIASINGESAVNAFPEKVDLKGVIRTYNMELKDKLIEKIISGSKAISEIYGCSSTVRIVDGYPSLKNSTTNNKRIKNTDAVDVDELEMSIPGGPIYFRLKKKLQQSFPC